MKRAFSAAAAAILVGRAVAQTPVFLGELLLEPGLTSAKCLTAASNTDGAAVAIQPCTGDTAQKWTFDGEHVKVFGNKCLDVPGGQVQDGVKLQIWSCQSSNQNQRFYYDKWGNTLSWSNGKCLDLPEGSTADGNRVHIWGCNAGNINQVWKTGYSVNALPQTSQQDQFGTNNCGTGNSQDSKCQTAWVNSATDFCLWAPPQLGVIGDVEHEVVAYCTKTGRGTRTMPNGTLKGVHFVKTPEYIQITGKGDFTKINIPKGDSGGELDNKGPDARGNPIGGLLFGNSFGNALQYHEWTSFISDSEFCIRACVGARATELCNHIYDVMGCYWNMPANYEENQYEECEGDAAIPMGVYGTSTWHQGVNPTPPPHPAPSSSNCQSVPSITVSPMQRRGLADPVEKRLPFPGATQAPVL